MDADLAWSVVAAILMVIGLCGVIIPVLPGLVLIWIVALVYGLIVGFGAAGVTVMIALTILVIASFVTGILIPRRAASESGASGFAQVGAVVGAIIGFFLVPVVGVIVGALAGLLVVETSIKGDVGEAWIATKATAKGFGLSALIDLTLGVIMIALWSVWAATVVL